MFRETFIITVTLAFCFYLTGCKDEKKAIVDSMIKYGAYEGMYLGRSEKISPQWKNFEALTQKFSENEIAELCAHKNPIVRCYAFKALTEICSLKVYDILLMHLSDTAEFDGFYGCFRDKDRVTDNFLDEVGYDKQEPTKFNLTEEQYNHIDSILLFRNEIKQRSCLGSIKFRSRRYMLQRTKPLLQFYKRVREIVTDGVYEALPLLARYQNESDTNIFKRLLLDDEFSNRGRTLKNYIRNSIKYFPHPSFYPILKEQLLSEVGTNAISDRYESFPLYLALVQYPTIDTRNLFQTALKNSGDEYYQRSGVIYEAIKRYPSKIFESVIKDVPNVVN
jgi:hypothetical protein